MALMIYNSLTRNKEIFVPLDPGGKKVAIYNCGPTVYDRFHIGNARNFVVMDIVRRYMEQWLGYDVTFIQNLTDIDDKIIQKAQERKCATEEVTREFIDAYHADAAKLGVHRADRYPRATEFVEPMIAFMLELEAKGYAYAAGGSLYFRVRKFAEYGKLSGRDLSEMREGARIQANEDKEDPLDFVLWKASKPGEPRWPSPWGEGRPGWHTECAVMSLDLLGETIDIHAGGQDLQFPHHENEIAQRECLSGRPFARYWMHNGFLKIDEEKMSKSIGNIKKIDQVLALYPAEVVRHFLLSAGYRHPLDYTRAALEEAKSAVHRINDALETAEKILALGGRSADDASLDLEDQRVKPHVDRFKEAMDDDFNTARASAVLFDIVSAIHEIRQSEPPDYDELQAALLIGRRLRDFFGFGPGTGAQPREPEAKVESANVTSTQSITPDSREFAILTIIKRVYDATLDQNVQDLASFFTQAMDRRGIELDGVARTAIEWAKIDNENPKRAMIELLIEARSLARQQKAFAIADAIRTGLGEAGIALEDHPQGTIWKEMQSSDSRP